MRVTAREAGLHLPGLAFIVSYDTIKAEEEKQEVEAEVPISEITAFQSPVELHKETLLVRAASPLDKRRLGKIIFFFCSAHLGGRRKLSFMLI